MADRTSAALFGMLFKLLAEEPTADRKLMARRVWCMKHEGGYDFSDRQMESDAALMALGLARKGINPDYPEDGEVVLYGPEGQS
jgi:hypothetical protein